MIILGLVPTADPNHLDLQSVRAPFLSDLNRCSTVDSLFLFLCKILIIRRSIPATVAIRCSELCSDRQSMLDHHLPAEHQVIIFLVIFESISLDSALPCLVQRFDNRIPASSL